MHPDELGEFRTVSIHFRAHRNGEDRAVEISCPMLLRILQGIVEAQLDVDADREAMAETVARPY